MKIGDPKNHAVDILDREIQQYRERRAAVAAEAYTREQELAKLDEILMGLQQAILRINEASNAG